MLDDVSCLLHLSIRGRLLDRDRILRDATLEMMVTYMRDDPRYAWKDIEDI